MTFLRPAMTYFSASLITVSAKGVYSQKRLLKNTPRHISGVDKCTPIDALLLYIAEIPMQYEAKKSALTL